MRKKKKFLIDIETCGLNGPGMMKDIDIRNAINVIEEIKEGVRASYGSFDIEFINFRPSGQGDLPKTVDVMKFMEDFYEGMVVIPHNTNGSGRTIYNEEDLYKGTMHDKTREDFINGDIKHMLWGSQPGDKEYNTINDGDYYWVKVYGDSEWEIGKLNTVCGRGGYYFEMMDSLTTANYNRVHDFTLIEKPE